MYPESLSFQKHNQIENISFSPPLPPQKMDEWKMGKTTSWLHQISQDCCFGKRLQTPSDSSPAVGQSSWGYRDKPTIPVLPGKCCQTNSAIKEHVFLNVIAGLNLQNCFWLPSISISGHMRCDRRWEWINVCSGIAKLECPPSLPPPPMLPTGNFKSEKMFMYMMVPHLEASPQEMLEPPWAPHTIFSNYATEVKDKN